MVPHTKTWCRTECLRLRFRIAMLRAFGEVHSAVKGKTRDSGLTAGHDQQTNSNPTTSIELHLSTSTVGNSSQVADGARVCGCYAVSTKQVQMQQPLS